jgi:uncharacterized protein
MNEKPFYLRNKNYRLFCVLHTPENVISPDEDLNKKPDKTGLVFCNPFAEESIIAHRIMVNLARYLTSKGYFCLRFDYMGEGDSENNFEESDIQSRLSDIHCAVEHLKDEVQVQKVGLVGVRLGATLAAISCETVAIDYLALVSPIVRGENYANELLRSNISFQMAAYRKILKDRKTLSEELRSGRPVNVDGYMLTPKLYDEIKQMDILDYKIDARPEILVLSVMKNKKQPMPKDILSLYDRLKERANGSKLAVTEELFFWKDNRIYRSSVSDVEKELADWLQCERSTPETVVVPQ